MSTFVTKQSEIPEALFYVCATDTFLSGWGKSDGRNNRVILPCVSYMEAERVEAYARSQSDMRRVTICGSKPTLRNQYNTYSLMDRSDSSAWYNSDLQ